MSDIRIGLIGGSGLGVLMAREAHTVTNVIQTPFGPPSAPILETAWNNLPVFILPRHGAGHVLNPSQVPYRANIFALKKLGVTHILATGAVGSLRDEYRPRDLVIPDQIIDKTRRPGTFFDTAAVHVEFAEPFDARLRQILFECAAVTQQGSEDPAQKPAVHQGGCYVAMEGPAFSTRAESLMHRLWGGDLIGMTAMPEAKLAREAEIAYALVALVTDYDCWKHPTTPKESPLATDAPKPDQVALLKEIIDNLDAASSSGMALIKAAVEKIAAEPGRLADSPARQALKLAIWSDKSQIDRKEVERLAPLWLHYFGDAGV